MTVNKRDRFASLPAGPDYLLQRWPDSLGAMQLVGFSQPCARRDLAAICRWAGLPDRGRAAGRVPASAVSRLIAIAARRRSGNHYHQPGHYLHVVMAAGFLARAAGLSRDDRALLVIAALVHDLDHHGKRSSSRPYAQERWSAARVRRVLGRAGADIRLAGRLERLLLATAGNDDSLRLTILASDPLARYLTDADLFGSVFYRRDLALAMTRKLKLEQQLPGRPDRLLAHFAARIAREGLRSAMGRNLYARLAISREEPLNTVNHGGWDEFYNVL